MRRIALFPVSILFCLVLASTVDAQQRTRKKALLAIDEGHLDKSIRTRVRIVGAEALLAEATAGAQPRTTPTTPRPSASQSPPRVPESAELRKPSKGEPLGPPVAGTAYAAISVIAVRPDGGWLAVAVDWGTMLIWESETGRVVPVLTGQDLVQASALSPDGLWMASTTRQDKTVRLWNAKDGVLSRTIGPQTNEVYKISFSPDGRRIAVASQDVSVWDVTTGVRETTLPHYARKYRQEFVFSPDGRMLAATSEGEIKLWETATWKPLKTLQGHKGGVESLAFSADGQWLASGGDGVVKLWQIATAKAIRTFSGLTYPNTLAFSPDGSLLASEKFDRASDTSSIVLWDVNTGLEVRSLPAPQLMTFAFGPGKRLASGDADGTVKLWDTSTGEVLLAWAPAPEWRWEVTGVTRSGEAPAGFTPTHEFALKPGQKPGDEYCVLQLSLQNLSQSAQVLELQSLEPRLVHAGYSYIARDMLWKGKNDVLKTFPPRTGPRRFHASMRDKEGNFEAHLWEEPGGTVNTGVTIFPARTTTLWLVFEIPRSLPTDQLRLRSIHVAPIPIVSAKKGGGD